MNTLKIKSIKKIDAQDKYDLEIKDNHNFFANSVLVHNCRCIARWEGNDIICRSRNGKEIIPVKFIRDTLARFLPKHVVFDGELYNHDYKEDFNKIISLVRKTKPRIEDVQECNKLIEYHVYDCFDLEHPNVVFNERHKLLNELIQTINSDKIKVVTTHFVSGLHTKEGLDTLYGTYLEDGYEGQMVRLNTSYEHKRSKSLIKRKEFKDDEFIVTGIDEGKGKRAGQAGSLIMQTHTGLVFNGAIKGSDAFRATIFNNSSDVIGKKAHVRFFDYTPDGVPRFPVVHSIRDYE